MAKPYQVLGVNPGANEATINAAFRRAAKDCHPDLHGNDPAAARRFRRLVAARAILKDPERHGLYTSGTAHQSLIFRPPSQRKRVMAAGAITGIAALLILPLAIQVWKSAPAVGRFQTATSTLEVGYIPDTWSAETKAVRDMTKESRLESLRDNTSMNRNSHSQRRAIRPRPPTMRTALFQLSRRLRMLASKLSGT